MGRLASGLVSDADDSAVIVDWVLSRGTRRVGGVWVVISVAISIAVTVAIAGGGSGISRRALRSCGAGGRCASGDQKY